MSFENLVDFLRKHYDAGNLVTVFVDGERHVIVRESERLPLQD